MIKKLLLATMLFVVPALAQGFNTPATSQQQCGYSDASACKTTPATGSAQPAWIYVWNGTTWVAVPGDVTNGIYVNPKQLPPGASTAANQTTSNTWFSNILNGLFGTTSPSGQTSIKSDQGAAGSQAWLFQGYSVAPIVSTSAEACHLFKASAGTVYSLSGYIGASGWIMVFDAASAPPDGAVTPKAWAYAQTAGSWSISYGSNPGTFSTGIVVCASSTGPLTKTAYSTNTVFSGQVQ